MASAEMRDYPESESGSIGPGFIAVIGRRWPLVAFGVIVGLLGGFLFHMQRPAVFQSNAQLLVVKKRSDSSPQAATDGRTAYVEDYVATQVTLIKSDVIMQLAGDRLKKEKLLSFAPDVDLAGIIPIGLTVNRDKDASGMSNNILNLAYRCGNGHDAQKILQTVIHAYKDFLDTISKTASDDTIKRINRDREALQKDLDELLKSYQKSHSALLLESAVALSDLKARINANETQRTTLELRKIDLNGRKTIVDRVLRDGGNRLALMAALDAAGVKRPQAPDRTQEDALFTLRLQEIELNERLGKDHPEVVSLKRRIQMIQKYLGAGNAETGAKQYDPLELYSQAIDQEIAQINTQQDYLDKLLREDRKVAQRLEELRLEETVTLSRADQVRKNLDDLRVRKQNLELAKEDSPYDSRAVTPPREGVQIAPILYQSLLFGAILGLLGGVGLAWLGEITDLSFRSPEEIRQRLGLPIIGHIPPISGKPPESRPAGPLLDTSLCTVHRPRSLEAEAYRAVRTSLYFSMQGRGHSLIQVTSPNMGDGKSTLAANLAVSIAQSGKRVVLVDADFRRPRVHFLFGASGEVGLASVMLGEATLEQAVRPSGVPNLSILPCGPRPANPAELLTSSEFHLYLQKLRDQFDFVLVDTPPLLAVSDPCAVAPRVDGVILTVQIVKNGRPAAERAREILSSLGAKVLGVVVNGKNTVPGSTYGYGSGYGYGYGYGEESDSKEYYDESTGKVKQKT